jgi:TrmH family RNA methyltransferase
MQIECVEVSDKVMAACSDTETPAGILAVMPMPRLAPAPRPTFVLIVDALRDPGNLGALLRSAAAAGVDAVWLAPGTVDAYSPKVVRGAMGAHFRIPIDAIEWDRIATHVDGLDVWLADGAAETSYTQVDWTRPCALIVGGEAHGASAEAARLARGRARIPMARAVESLNAGVAASVILFEAARQRRAETA